VDHDPVIADLHVDARAAAGEVLIERVADERHHQLDRAGAVARIAGVHAGASPDQIDRVARVERLAHARAAGLSPAAGAATGLPLVGAVNVASSRTISARRSAFSRYGMKALLKPETMISFSVSSGQP